MWEVEAADHMKGGGSAYCCQWSRVKTTCLHARDLRVRVIAADGHPLPLMRWQPPWLGRNSSTSDGRAIWVTAEAAICWRKVMRAVMAAWQYMSSSGAAGEVAVPQRMVVHCRAPASDDRPP